MADYVFWLTRTIAIVAGVTIMLFPDPLPLADEVVISLGLAWFTFGMPNDLLPAQLR